MAKPILKLGDVVFGDTETGPIPFGGEQQLNVHRLVGGKRVIDAMGDNPIALDWTGIFVGAKALANAKTLRRMQKEGRALDLTWSSMTYQVVISKFTAQFEAEFNIPYSISCEVVEDRTQLPSANSGSDVNQAVKTDMTTAQDLTKSVNDNALTSLMTTLTTAVSKVSDFAKSTQSEINTMLQPLEAARTRVATLISENENTLKSVTTVGGLLPNNALAKSVASLTSQASATLNSVSLAQLDAVFSRIQKNLGQVNSSLKTVTVSGGNLYDLAVKYYRKATSYTTLANANNRTDPEMNGVSSVSVTKDTNDTNGVQNP